MTQGERSKPRKPAEPDPSDCCGSGCPRCIFDIHEEAMQRYRAALAEWKLQPANKPTSGDA
jgi:hypothetical protein